MINTSTSVIGQLELYEAIYASNAPQKKNSLAFKVHRWIGLLINAHFLKITELSDLISLNETMAQFVRELKSEFDMIYINYEDYSYPAFINKLSALRYGGPLEEYHNMIIETLKIILFRAGTDTNQEKAENYLWNFIEEKINKIKPPENKKTMFGDKSEISSQKFKHDVEEYIRRQIDISLDK